MIRVTLYDCFTGKTYKKVEPPRLREPFPSPQGKAKVVLAPTYQPSPEKFCDPIEYIESIRPDAEPYGLCCIVPPEVWKVSAED